MRWPRGRCEAGLHVLTTAAVCLSLAHSAGGKFRRVGGRPPARPPARSPARFGRPIVCTDPGPPPHLSAGHRWALAGALALLCAAALAADAGSNQFGRNYTPREEPSPGLGLGALALPWLLGGLLTAAGGSGTAPLLAVFYQAALAAAALQLALLCRRSAPVAAGALAAAGAAALGPSGAGALPYGAAATLLAAAEGCLALHVVMRRLPRTFTLGEGMAVSQVRGLPSGRQLSCFWSEFGGDRPGTPHVSPSSRALDWYTLGSLGAEWPHWCTPCPPAQALVLLGGYALHIVLRCGLTAFPLQLGSWRCAAASPFQAFVACLVFVALALAAAVAALLGSPAAQQAGRAGGKQQANGGAGNDSSNGKHRKGVRKTRSSWRVVAAMTLLGAGDLVLLRPVSHQADTNV